MRRKREANVGKAILYDSTLCIGCRLCEAACAEKWGLPYDDAIAAEEKLSERKLTTIVTRGGRFIRRMCMHCAEPTCASVCPVGAFTKTAEGPVLYDESKCIGCRYCIQACPYGARFLHPETRTAEKCTFCYHRITQGKVPACVEVCPTGARIFGEVGARSSTLDRFTRFNEIQVLKPHLNTEPKVYYAHLDGEVR